MFLKEIHMSDTLKIGQINGHDIVAVPSNQSCFATVPEEWKDGCAHIIGNPAEKMTREEAYKKGITPEGISALFRDSVGHIKHDIVTHFLPNHAGETCGARTEMNDLTTATVDTVHVHFELALAEHWSKKKFRRCVDSIMVPTGH